MFVAEAGNKKEITGRTIFKGGGGEHKGCLGQIYNLKLVIFAS
jgi:hypothetical protein